MVSLQFLMYIRFVQRAVTNTLLHVSFTYSVKVFFKPSELF